MEDGGCCEMLSPGRDVAIALMISWQLSLPHTDKSGLVNIYSWARKQLSGSALP